MKFHERNRITIIYFYICSLYMIRGLEEEKKKTEIHVHCNIYGEGNI